MFLKHVQKKGGVKAVGQNPKLSCFFSRDLPFTSMQLFYHYVLSLSCIFPSKIGRLGWATKFLDCFLQSYLASKSKHSVPP